MTLTFYVQFPETDKPVYPKQGGGSTTDIKEAMIFTEEEACYLRAKEFAGKYSFQFVNLG